MSRPVRAAIQEIEANPTHWRRFRPYPAYRDCGVPWLGEVPCSWSLKRLKYVARVIMGQSPPSEEYSTDADGLPFLQGNADFGPLSPAPRIFCPTAAKRVPENSLLLSVRAPVGALNVADQSYGIGRGLCAVIPRNTDLVTEFAWYLLHVVREQLQTLATGSTYEAVTADEVASMTALLPTLSEQKAIAAFLDRETARIDELVAKKTRLIELLQEKRTALISHAVTKGLNSNTPMKDSGIPWLGAVPSHWQSLKFRNAAFFQEGPGLRHWQFTDSGIRVVCVTNITEAGVTFEAYQKFIAEDEYRKCYKHFTVAIGDLLLSSSGNSWGKVAEFHANETAILNTSTIRVNANRTSTLRRSFIKWVLQARGTREQLGLMMTGSCQPNFGPTHLAMTIVAVPPPNEQIIIARYLDEHAARLDHLVDAIQQATEKLHEYRSALISAAVTGQIDVRNTRDGDSA